MARVNNGYQPYFPAARPDKEFEKRFKYGIIRSEEELLDKIGDIKGKVVSVDTETKGLDFSVPNHLVGIVLSTNLILSTSNPAISKTIPSYVELKNATKLEYVISLIFSTMDQGS